MKKRILVLLSVVALMMVMLAMSVAPGFAAPKPKSWVCFNPTTGALELAVTKDQKKDFEAQGFECRKPPRPR